MGNRLNPGYRRASFGSVPSKPGGAFQKVFTIDLRPLGREGIYIPFGFTPVEPNRLQSISYPFSILHHDRYYLSPGKILTDASVGFSIRGRRLGEFSGRQSPRHDRVGEPAGEIWRLLRLVEAPAGENVQEGRNPADP
jgi:hypothetical protein